MPSTIVNGIDLYYEIHGKGEPLMLIAGLASDSQSWQPIMEDLSRNYRVITPDNRGVGRTKPSDINISIQKITDDCISLVRHLGLSSVNMLGHSMGGFVALDCAIRYP
ncbi:MAG: alpha/beta hydrolase [Candidatus Celaenobacter antarcticus]|nr:alpha/beta hydrolase [Candidatus Celaenobacter antarcticus]